MGYDGVVAKKVSLEAAKSMLHQGRFSCARLPFDPKHAIVCVAASRALPLLELGRFEQPLACFWMWRSDVVLTSINVAECKGTETGYHWLVTKGRYKSGTTKNNGREKKRLPFLSCSGESRRKLPIKLLDFGHWAYGMQEGFPLPDA